MPWRDVAHNVRLGLEGLNLSTDIVNQRIDEVLNLTGLSDFKDRWPHQLSGGQVQRVGIARALAVQPDILLMDEPFSAVDTITRQSLQQELVRIWQASGAAVLFITHDIEEAAYLSDRVIVLKGQPAEIVQRRIIRSLSPCTSISIDTYGPVNTQTKGSNGENSRASADIQRFRSDSSFPLFPMI